jgi:hypothetical protein
MSENSTLAQGQAVAEKVSEVQIMARHVQRIALVL